MPQAFIESITINLGQPAFQDPAVREALYSAMDKKSIIDADLLRPAEARPRRSCPTQSWAFNPDLPKQEYDPDKAKQILDAAGWKPGAGGIREKNGVRLDIHQLDHGGQPRARAGAATAAAELAGDRRRR